MDDVKRFDPMKWIAVVAVALLCVSGVVWPVLYYSQGNQAVVALTNVQLLQGALAQRTAELENIKKMISDFNAAQEAKAKAAQATE